MSNPNPLNPKVVSEKIRKLVDDANMGTQTVVHHLNAVNFERAIQLGYQLACHDNGLPVPTFQDPLDALLKRL